MAVAMGLAPATTQLSTATVAIRRSGLPRMSCSVGVETAGCQETRDPPSPARHGRGKPEQIVAIRGCHVTTASAQHPPIRGEVESMSWNERLMAQLVPRTRDLATLRLVTGPSGGVGRCTPHPNCSFRRPPMPRLPVPLVGIHAVRIPRKVVTPVDRSAVVSI